MAMQSQSAAMRQPRIVGNRPSVWLETQWYRFEAPIPSPMLRSMPKTGKLRDSIGQDAQHRFPRHRALLR